MGRWEKDGSYFTNLTQKGKGKSRKKEKIGDEEGIGNRWGFYRCEVEIWKKNVGQVSNRRRWASVFGMSILVSRGQVNGSCFN